MRYLKRNGYTGSIRKVVSDDKSTVFGLVGTVEDLLNESVFDYCDCPKTLWAFIQARTCKVWFGYSREDVINNALVYKFPSARSL